MTASSPTRPLLAPAAAPATLSARGRAAVVIGNCLECYDFVVFSFFAVMIGDAFFPAESATARLLGALATFGVGFVSRPIGAAVLGAHADRVGRRSALTWTLMLMSLGSALIALTPGYAQIGVAAPVVLVLARLIQGFSWGGEVGPATTFLLESAPAHRRVAATVWQGHSQGIATFLGSLVGLLLATALTHEQLYAWGWRVPFALGTLIAPVGLYIRRHLPETLAPQEVHASAGAVFGALLRDHLRAVLAGVLVISGATISTYVGNYMTTYAITTLHLSPQIGTGLVMAGSVALVAGLALGAHADRYGRKPVLLLSRVVYVLAIYPAYRVMTAPGTGAATLVLVHMGLTLLLAIGLGPVYAFLSEAFPKAVRSSGLGILYAVGVMVFGGTTQFVVAWLIDRTHSPMVPAWYLIAANLASIAGVVWLQPHRAPGSGPASPPAA